MPNRTISENFELGIAHPVEWPGVTVDTDCGFDYSGDADALIATGLARREWLPGELGCPNKITFTTRVDGRKVCFRRKSRRKFFVCFEATEAERDAWLRRRDLDHDVQHIAKFEASLPADQESFRKRLMEQFCGAFLALKSPLVSYVTPDSWLKYVDGSGGYKLPESTLEQLSDLMHEGLDILRCSPVIFNAGRRQREIAAIRLTIAKDDSGFQELLSNVSGDGDVA
jgi:hypothetical protein